MTGEEQWTWVRFEQHKRYHAVLRMNRAEGIVTWCGRRVLDKYDLGSQPPQRCRGCVSKMRHPYLVCRERGQ